MPHQVQVFQFPVTGLDDPSKCATSYVAIQYQGCVKEGEDVRGTVDGETPEFWAVYGRQPDGCAEWVADFGNELLCWMFAAQMSRIMGIPVEGTGFNLAPLEAAVFMMNNQGAAN